MKVSVVVTAYNAEQTIAKCLASILANEYDDYELIVVDDCSRDGTPGIIKEISDQRLHYFRNPTNQKVSYSRNTGIRKAGGEIILFLDSDAYVEKDWIARHVEAHGKTGAAIIGGGIQGMSRTVFGKADAFCTWYASVPFSGNYYIKKLHVASNNMSVRKTALDRIGLFDETLTNGGEDTEFCFRARRLGEKIYFKSDLVAYHFDRDNCRDYFRHQKSMGKYMVQIRSRLKMDYSFLIPTAYYPAYLYIIPLACLLTLFILKQWLRFRPGVLFYAPLILAGKIVHTWEIKNSLKPGNE